MAQSILLQRLPKKTQFFLGGGDQKKFSALHADSVPPTLTAGFRPWSPNLVWYTNRPVGHKRRYTDYELCLTTSGTALIRCACVYNIEKQDKQWFGVCLSICLSRLKLAFYDADTDSDIDTNILATIIARMSARMSVSVSVSASWNASFSSADTQTGVSTRRGQRTSLSFSSRIDTRTHTLVVGPKRFRAVFASKFATNSINRSHGMARPSAVVCRHRTRRRVKWSFVSLMPSHLISPQLTSFCPNC